MLTRSLAILTALSLVFLGACSDDGASVRDLGGDVSSGSGSGSGTGSGSGAETACEEPADDAVEVTLAEYTVTTDEEEFEAVPSLAVTNRGEEVHELVVVEAPNIESLPLSDEGGVDEEKLDPGALVAEIEEVAPGSTCALDAELNEGTYVLLCNILDGKKDHFLRGMRTRIKVSG